MKILLIEDDAVIAGELLMRWRKQGIELSAVRTLKDATAAFNASKPDFIVLDLGLPDGDGLQWLTALRQEDSSIPVMVLTARDRVADRVRGLKSGADDYLVKPFAIEELDARIEVLLRRIRRQEEDSAQFGPLRWLGQDGVVEIGDQQLELTPREFQVLGILVRRAPRLVSKRVLVDELSERNLDVGDGAVEVYVSRLRRKLAGTGLGIRNMRGFGYMLIQDPDGADQGEQK
jgi:DNA-binding response OmpR family regulator